MMTPIVPKADIIFVKRIQRKHWDLKYDQLNFKINTT